MNFRVLQSFLAAASTLNFSQAAENLHIAQSTLSQQIQQLEEGYSVKLFYRNGRSLSLTPAGLLLQQWAARVLQEHSLLEQKLKTADSWSVPADISLPIFFDLHIMEAPDLSASLIAALRTLAEKNADAYSIHPSYVSLDMDGSAYDISRILDDPQLDFWVFGCERAPNRTKFVFEIISDDPLALIISANHPLFREDLSPADIPYLVNRSSLYLPRGRSHYFGNMLDALNTDHLTPTIRFEDSVSMNAFHVAAGEGVSVVPFSNFSRPAPFPEKRLPIPNSHYYTVAAYRSESANPLLPQLMMLLKARSQKPGQGEAP